MRYLIILLFLSIPLITRAAWLDTLWFHSDCMDTLVPVLYVEPESGFDNQTPVVVLLHGYGGDYTSWVRNSDKLPILADKFNVVFVAPDAGNSWYQDTDAVGNKLCGLTLPGEELILFLRDSLGLASMADRTAICGNSMGGQGALRVAMKYPGNYGYIGSLSGVVDLTASRKATEIRTMFYGADTLTFDSLSVIHHLEELMSFDGDVFLDCGNDDYLLPGNAMLHQQLLDKGIGHVWLNRPGAHNWDYWNKSIMYFMVFLDERW